eukprot:1408692-Pleurochrysis_carterae.AAC.1
MESPGWSDDDERDRGVGEGEEKKALVEEGRTQYNVQRERVESSKNRSARKIRNLREDWIKQGQTILRAVVRWRKGGRRREQRRREGWLNSQNGKRGGDMMASR